MTASVIFQGAADERADDVIVPLSALVAASEKVPRDGEHQLAVFVVDEDNRVRERAVWTDDIVRSSIIVTNNVTLARDPRANLRVRERVVTAGASQLREGQRVRPVARGRETRGAVGATNNPAASRPPR
jgi:hypothetical protein